MKIGFREEHESVLDSACHTALDFNGPFIFKKNDNTFATIIYCIKRKDINSEYDVYLPFWMQYLYNLDINALNDYIIEPIKDQSTISSLDSLSVEWIEVCTGPDPFLSIEIQEALEGLFAMNGSIFTTVIRGFKGYVKIYLENDSDNDNDNVSFNNTLLPLGKITKNTKITALPRLSSPECEMFDEMSSVLSPLLTLIESFDKQEIVIEGPQLSVLPLSNPSLDLPLTIAMKQWPWLIVPMPLRLQEPAIRFVKEYYSSSSSSALSINIKTRNVLHMDFQWSLQDSNVQDSSSSLSNIYSITRHLRSWLSSQPKGTIIIIEDLGLIDNQASFSRLRSVINQFPDIIFISFCMNKQEFLKGTAMMISPNLKAFNPQSIVPQVDYKEHRLIMDSMSFYDLDNMQFLIDHLQNELDYTEEEAIKEAFEQAQKLDNECLERWPVNDKVKWSDIIGHETTIKKLKAMIYGPIQDGELFYKLGLRQTRGILLYGPTGIGKTMMIQALVNDHKINVYRLLIDKTLSQYFGQSEANLRGALEYARGRTPCIVVIEDIEWIGLQRGISDDNTGVGERLLSTLLNEIDGISSSTKADSANNKSNDEYGLILLATSRCREKIDSALLRPGRLDFHLRLDYLDRKTNRELIHSLSKEFSVNIESDKEERLLDLCDNLSPSEIKAQFKTIKIFPSADVDSDSDNDENENDKDEKVNEMDRLMSLLQKFREIQGQTELIRE